MGINPAWTLADFKVTLSRRRILVISRGKVGGDSFAALILQPTAEFIAVFL